MSFIYSRALAEASWPANFWDIPAYAQSKKNPMPKLCLLHDKTMDTFRLSQFGMMSRPLMEDLGAELLTLWLAASRAKTLVLRGEASELKASVVDCGSKWQGSFARLDPNTFTWKTVQCSLLADSELFSETWPRWGSMQNGACSVRIMPELPMNVNESGLLPTPTASNTKAHHMRGADKGKAREPRSYGAHGPLNPRFLEWHMGWPVGWTKLEPLETGKFQEWQQQHGNI
jgi:hypothetical protein